MDPLMKSMYDAERSSMATHRLSTVAFQYTLSKVQLPFCAPRRSSLSHKSPGHLPTDTRTIQPSFKTPCHSIFTPIVKYTPLLAQRSPRQTVTSVYSTSKNQNANEYPMANRVSAAVAASLASGGTESVGFLNDIIRELWDYINAAGAKMTREIAEPMFKEMLPGPLSSLHFTKIDLGTQPIILDNVDVHSRHEGAIKLDIDVMWNGNSDIQLAAKYIGSFGVGAIQLSGRMSVLLTPLIDRIPLVAAVQLAFINPPNLHIDFTGLAEIAEFSLIESTMYKIIDKVLANIMVLPSRMLIKLDPNAPWYKTFMPDLGIIRVKVERGYGFKVPKGWFKDVPDVFCKVRIGAFPEWRTRTVKNSVEPDWNESADFLLSDHDQAILIETMDDDKTNSDDALGKTYITAGNLLLNNKTSELSLFHDGEDTGAKIIISCQVFDLVSDMSSLSAVENQDDRYICGLLTILVAGAKKIPAEREDASSCVKVTAFDKKFTTNVVANAPNVDALNPSYDAAFRVPLSYKMLREPDGVTLTLLNDGAKLGKAMIPFEDIQNAENATLIHDFPLDCGASISACLMLRGTKLAESH